MLDGNGILQQVRDIVSQRVVVEIESVDFDLLEAGAIDSLSLTSLLFELEQCFEISFDLESLEIDDFRSIARIAELVRSHAQPASAREEQGA